MDLSTFNSPLIMGIINLTPDSFFDGGKYADSQNLIKEKFNQADIIDIGCESSRPGADPLSAEHEIQRLDQYLDFLNTFQQPLSIDTYKPEVAVYALENGFEMINDIQGGGNGHMFEVAEEFGCPIVIMHMAGSPKTMQESPLYSDVVDEIITYFDKQIALATIIGVEESQIILDPGIGFGKRLEDNFNILKNIPEFKKLGFPILVGLSRKSFLSINGDTPDERLAATLTASAYALQKGADILRVHDIADTSKLITTHQNLTASEIQFSKS
ncbi:MAG: dihydropteroate synthase [Candidatus Marinimicrobia bacterium]|nr:dihydropteroate synthase [Candidatus Neomarinimicrobiota bacterium]